LDLEFEKYSIPMYYPKEQEIYNLSEVICKTEDVTVPNSPSDEVRKLVNSIVDLIVIFYLILYRNI
jgi:hypothetical protein